MTAIRSAQQQRREQERNLSDPLTADQVHPPRKTRRGHQGDIEGLRAIAILAVVLYHAHVSALGGGYVGVDVFFVVSGFLITSLLWGELNDQGRVSFFTFYARRVRRLLPAAVLVIVATVIVSAILLAPLEAQSAAKDGIASALYVANYRFALQHTSYLSATSTPSPL